MATLFANCKLYLFIINWYWQTCLMIRKNWNSIFCSKFINELFTKISFICMKSDCNYINRINEPFGSFLKLVIIQFILCCLRRVSFSVRIYNIVFRLINNDINLCCRFIFYFYFISYLFNFFYTHVNKNESCNKRRIKA